MVCSYITVQLQLCTSKSRKTFAINSLEVNGTNLFAGINQLLNGDEVIESAVNEKGTQWLCTVQ